MISPEDMETYGYGHEQIFLGLEQRIMDDIARRIRQTGVITRTADFQINQIKRLGYHDADIKKMIQETLSVSQAYVDNLYAKALKTDYIDNKKLYQGLGKEFIPFEKNTLLQNILKTVKLKTNEEMKNLTGSMGFVINAGSGNKAVKLTDYLQSVLDQAVIDINAGAFDYNTILTSTVKQMTNSGVRWIDYESGYHNRITVAARRAVMKSISDMAATAAEDTAEKLGIDTFEVSAHANARPEHASWQGKVYTKKELISICGLGTITGLHGANCYHDYYPFVKGLSKRAYTDHQLKQMRNDGPKEYKGKSYTGYEAKQRMRQLETNMRAQREAIRLLKDNGADDLKILETQVRYRQTMKEYVDFADKMQMKQQKERIFMDGNGKQMVTIKRMDQYFRMKPFMKAQGIVISDSGLVSTKISAHFVDQAINRKIDVDSIVNALKKPLLIDKIKVDHNGWSQKIIGEKVSVVINPGSGNLITVHQTSSKKARKLKKEADEK